MKASWKTPLIKRILKTSLTSLKGLNRTKLILKNCKTKFKSCHMTRKSVLRNSTKTCQHQLRKNGMQGK